MSISTLAQKFSFVTNQCDSNVTDSESLEVDVRGFGFALDGVAGVITVHTATDATEELRADFECVAVVEELVLVLIDEDGITRRHGVEGAVGEKLEVDFTAWARTLRDDISLPLALYTPRATAALE